ncbi:MAG: shikimate dehydrogenase [Flavobacteriales bacterium]|nr:shikimate dehydrogenase [Flavobacteriales bacterium]|tara:strand:- start:4493 stop:5245 length:753 start_codon:yes stop_codon:yes gene_type:complete
MSNKKLGLIGYPLTHSFSAKYFAEKFDKEGISGFSYENFEIPQIEDFPDVIKNNPELVGLNVTIPYKEKIIPYLDELDEDAKEIGAVNTIKVIQTEHGVKLKGYNTDIHGFRETLKPLLKMHHYKALILGTGGAAKAVEYVLKKIGLDVLYVSRNPQSENERSYHELNDVAVKNFPVIINSTPLGMHPKVEECPALPYEYLTEDNLLYDLIYNPAETLFMKKGTEKGAITKNGLGMLKLQAEKAWEIWNE